MDRPPVRQRGHLMRGPLHEPVIAGRWPRRRWVFYVSDWEDERQTAQSMGRTADEFAGWPLAYRQESPGSSRWVWAAGDEWPKSNAWRNAA
jgi:hypothetical protein